jgi:hypothetical protein
LARALVLAAAVFAVFVTPVYASRSASSVARSTSSRAVVFVPIRVWIGGGMQPIPLVGATVRVFAGAGHRKAAKALGVGETFSRGLAIVVAKRKLPSAFYVDAAGGWIGKQRFRGHLTAQVRNHRRSELEVVDPATTLAATYCLAHRRLGRAQCAAKVRKFLSIPTGTDLGAGLVGDELFNGHSFLTVARRNGGVARYLALLAGQLGRGRRITSFAPGTASAVPAKLSGKAWPGIGDSGGWLDYLASVAKIAQGANAVAQLYSMLYGNGGSDQMANIDSALTQIQSELTALQADLTQIEQQLENQAAMNTFSTLVEGADAYASPISDAIGDFQAVVDEAAQIGCGNYTSQSVKPCASPQSPAQVCTTPNEASNSALSTACIAFGDLPIPGNTSSFYEDNPSDPAVVNSLVGQFVGDVVNKAPFSDGTLTTLEQDFGGPLGGGTGLAYGVLQQGSVLIAEESPFFQSPQSQQLEYLYADYFNLIAAGATMRAAYYGLENLTAGSPFEAVLTDYGDLYRSAPDLLPSGTFIDTAAYTMWSGQIGALLTQPAYSAQVNSGADITLPLSSASNAAPGATTPTIGGAPISNWSAAQASQLETLYADVPSSHNGTYGDYFTTGSPGLMWTGLVNNGVWDARSDNQVARNYDEESPPNGMSIAQTPDYGYPWGSGNLNTTWQQLPDLDVIGCTATANSNCSEPTWANGSPSGMFDLNLDDEMTGSSNSMWHNWSDDSGECTSLGQSGYGPPYCQSSRTYPGITPYMSAPVLYYRTPRSSSISITNECYYWPVTPNSAGSNGCPTVAPNPPTASGKRHG